MSDFTLTDLSNEPETITSAECRDGDSGDGNGFTYSIGDLNGVSFSAIRGNVMVHELEVVATTETMLW